MRISPALVALISFWEGVQAAPLAISGGKRLGLGRQADAQPQFQRRTVPYSVVPVDGGSPSTTVPAVENPPEVTATATVTDTIRKTMQPVTSIQTLVVTPPAVTLTASPVTLTASPVTLTAPPVTETVISTASNSGKGRKHTKTIKETILITKTHSATSTMMSMVTRTKAAAISTVTVDPSAAFSTTTKNYDNGMWHPPYPMTTITFPIQNATMTTSGTTSTTARN